MIQGRLLTEPGLKPNQGISRSLLADHLANHLQLWTGRVLTEEITL